MRKQQYKEQENPGWTAHTKTKDNRESYMNLEKHSEEQANHPSNEQEQTEKGEVQETEEPDKEQDPTLHNMDLSNTPCNRKPDG